MKIILFVSTKNCVHVHKFNTVTEAYKYYLHSYITPLDSIHYYNETHNFFNKVTNEETMIEIFKEYFNKKALLVLDN